MQKGSVAIALRRVEVGFQNVQRPNQFHQFSELVNMKSRVVVYGIWNRDLTCDHLQKAVVQRIRRGRGKCRHCLMQGGGRISKVCRDLINSISFLS